MKRKRRSYEVPKAGKWVQPVERGYLMQCCDCGLVHRMDFRVGNNRAQFRAWRAIRETAAVRKERRIRVKFRKG